MLKRRDILLLALIVGVAAALRFLWLDQYPPGWHHDEALMGVMASEVYQGIQRPIFFPAYAGQEPLYIYLAAAVMALLGGNQDILPLRITSALVGLATVLVAYLMGRELFSRRVGLIAAALLGTSFYQVMSSRNAYRSITQPLLEGLAVYFFWRARRTGSYRWHIAAGAAFAGTTYTYLGGRSFPAVLVAFGVWSLLFQGRPSRQHVKRLLALAAASVVVAAPVYAYWLANPGTYSARMNQVFILNPAVNQGQPLQYIADSVAKALQLFTIRGEMMWRYNLPGRPIFEWALVPAFYLGAAIVLWRAWRRDAAHAVLAIWMLVMLAPSVLSWDAGGYTLRATSLVPALYFFPALAIVAAWDWLGRERRWQAMARVGVPAALVALIVWDGALTYRDYFVEWGQHFGAAYEGDAHVVAQARYLAAEARPDVEDVFAGSDYRGHPIIAQLAPNVYKQLRWFDGRRSFVYSPSLQRDSLYALSFTTLPSGRVERYLPPESLVAFSRFDSGIVPGDPPPKYLAYRLKPEQVRALVDRWLTDRASVRLEADFSGEIELLAAQVPREVTQGEKLPVTVIWRVLSPPRSEDYMFFVHLLDEQAVMWAQVDRNGYPTPEWRPGDVVVASFDLDVPADLAPGKYLVDFGLYDRKDLRLLPVVGSTPGKSSAVLSTLKVSAAQRPAMARNSLDQPVGKSFKLLGFDLGRDRSGDGREFLDLRLVWSALEKPLEDYTVFVQVLSPEGKLVFQSDAMPASNRFPTSLWDAGDVIEDKHRLALDPKLSAGSYRLIAGMYLLSSGQRLAVGSGDHVALTDVTIGR